LATGLNRLSKPGHETVRSQPNRLLLSARDIGAAGHIIALASGLQAAGYTVDLVMQGPALNLARQLGIACEDAAQWLDCGHPLGAVSCGNIARRVDALSPSAIICGLSSFHTNGIDEALMLASRSRGTHCFAMQDFWGDVKRVNGRGADSYFVLDETAAKITTASTGADCHVIGSPKHVRFLNLDYEEQRDKFRKSAALGRTDKVVCLFGQALHAIPGHMTVLADLSAALSSTGDVRLVYKPHPLEDQASLASTLSTFADLGHGQAKVVDGPIEPILAGIDVALSCFSTVGLDAAYMTRTLGYGPAVIYADYPSDITAYWQNESGLTILPPVHDGYALEAKDRDSLATCLRDGFTPDVREQLYRQVHNTLPDPGTAIERAVSYIEQNLSSDADFPSSRRETGRD
jgi:hypothetical protein